ncbi:hypothetical protein JTE90_025782 [Oedothorax gibbosus]|uniref:Uncharacterized protein n=1 Tax=Oedothorax gibbosus TaxID=931172 RepID=A0AAV6V386_9ARAC|nr:hypothetical protein JTE90_025782 [Oedothorax gibbosus]
MFLISGRKMLQFLVLMVWLFLDVFKVHSNSCELNESKAECSLFCIFNGFHEGECKFTEGINKCHCYGEKNMEDIGAMERNFKDGCPELDTIDTRYFSSRF